MLWMILILPLLGSMLGCSCVFFLKKDLGNKTRKILSGFAAGVMASASVFSLLIPSMNQASEQGKIPYVPAALGFMAGVIALMFFDQLIPHIHILSGEQEGLKKSKANKTIMMAVAVALHNIPEGMAIGIVCAAGLSSDVGISMASALALSLGMAIQNFPEGAIVSMPLYAVNQDKAKSFWIGAFTGILEPVAAIVTILISKHIIPLMPYLLSFAAGSMMYVVVEELVPDMTKGKHYNVASIVFAIGYILMMVLDVALG